MRVGLSVIVAVLAAMPILSAASANPFSADSVVLNLRGLDLTSVDGQQRLAIRVGQAADTVCGTGMSSIHLALGAQAQACRSDVIANVHARIAAATARAETGKAAQLAMR
jgi:UrcA family protein